MLEESILIAEHDAQFRAHYNRAMSGGFEWDCPPDASPEWARGFDVGLIMRSRTEIARLKEALRRIRDYEEENPHRLAHEALLEDLR